MSNNEVTGHITSQDTLNPGGGVKSDGGLSAEEVEGHSREVGWDALLVVQVEVHHLSQGPTEVCLHQLHTASTAPSTSTGLEERAARDRENGADRREK